MPTPLSAYQTEVVVLQLDTQEDTVLRDGFAYTVTSRGYRLRGTLSLRRSTPSVLFFHGVTYGDWFKVDASNIYRVEP